MSEPTPTTASTPPEQGSTAAPVAHPVPGTDDQDPLIPPATTATPPAPRVPEPQIPGVNALADDSKPSEEAGGETEIGGGVKIYTPESAPKEPSGQPDDNEEVPIKKGDLRALVSGLQKAQSDIEMLKGVSDKARLANWESKNKGKLIRHANVTTWEDKVVLGWKMVKDEVFMRNGVLHEKQVIRLYIESESGKPEQVDVNYLDFSRNSKRIKGEVIEDATTSDGVRIFKLQFEDGKVRKFDIRFIN